MRISNYLINKLKKGRRFLSERGIKKFIFELLIRVSGLSSISRFLLIKHYSFRDVMVKIYSNEKKYNLNNIKVSFIIPTYNGMKDGLPNLIKSIKNQSFKNIEIIAVDSGSTDGTVEYLQNEGVKVIKIRKEEFSHDYARNLGAKNASGDFLVFTVQDAEFHDKDWVKKAILSCLSYGAVSFSSPQKVKDNADLYAKYLALNFITANEYKPGMILMGNKLFGKFLFHFCTEKVKESLIHVDDTNHLIKKEYFFKRGGYKFHTCEDMEFGKRIILDNQKWIYSTITSIKHSHTYRDFAKYFIRTFVDNVVINRILGRERKIKKRYPFVLDNIILYGFYFLSILHDTLKRFEGKVIKFVSDEKDSNSTSYITVLDNFTKKINPQLFLFSSLNTSYFENDVINSLIRETKLIIPQNDNLDIDLFIKFKEQFLNHIWKASRDILKIVQEATFEDYYYFLIHAGINVFSFELAKAIVLYEDDTSCNKKILTDLKWR